MEFYDQIRTLLERNQIDECSELFYSFESIQLVEDYSWELTSLFCEQITKQTEEKTVQFIRQASFYVAGQFGSPKELFLIYLENAESYFHSDTNYFLLVDLVQMLLLRLSAKLVYYSLELAINQLKKNILKNAQHSNIVSLTRKYVDFLSVFVDMSQSDQNMKQLLVSSLINLFNEPLIGIDLEEENTDKQDLVKKILDSIQKLNVNFFNLFTDLHKQVRIKTDSQALTISPLSLGSFVYVAYSRKYNLNKYELPSVYTGFYELRCLSPLLEDYLNQTQNQMALEKALLTFTKILNRIPLKSLERETFEILPIVETLQTLFKITVFSQFESVRKQTVTVLRLYFERFDRTGRHWFLHYFLHDNYTNESLNNYVSSFLIYLFKEEVNECLSTNEPFYAYHVKEDSKRVNLNFKRIFNLITKLNTSPQSNVIQEGSKISAVLNLIRFLLIKDKLNETGINELLIVSDYLSQLSKQVEATKSSYGYQKHNLLGTKDKNEADGGEIEVSTQNGTLTEPTLDDKISSVQNALQSIELIESLQTRCTELLNEKNL